MSANLKGWPGLISAIASRSRSKAEQSFSGLETAPQLRGGDQVGSG